MAASDPRASSLPSTKLVCTLGPATEDRLDELLAAGASVVRLNLAHGTPEEHARHVGAVRRAATAAGRPVAVLADLPGPKVRLGALPGGRLTLEAGDVLVLAGGDDPAGARQDRHRVGTTHPGLAADLRPGDHVHLADGAVELVVRRVAGRDVEAIVERGGTIRSRAGVILPAERLSLPVLSERDVVLARFAADAGVDLVGQSFVREAADVEALRALLGPGGPGIVAKIETRPAVDAFDAIAWAADAVMIARGDLGLALPFEEVPIVQKRLVARSRAQARPVIVATQMLESMVGSPRPTRAEASDVANAVLDGVDAVMLSGETAIGSFPIAAAGAAIRICRVAERATIGTPVALATAAATAPAPGPRDGDALAVAAVALADADPSVGALVVAADAPRAVAAVAARRPAVPVVAVLPDERSARRAAILRGVRPVVPADPSLASATTSVPAAALLADPVVAAVLTGVRRALVLAGGPAEGDGRIEVVADAGGAAGGGRAS